MRIQNKKILASILLLLISFVCMAQGGGAPPPPAPPPPPGLPIDGALPVFLFLAMLYGISRKIKFAKN